MQQQRWYVPWLYILPALAILGTLLVYPMIDTLIASFFDNYYRPSERAPTTFVGWDNYTDAFNDNAMIIAFRNNALWLLLMTSMTVGLGLVLAVLLDRVKYEVVAKSVIFMPMAISFTAASVIWRFVYAFKPPSQPQIGLLNGFLSSVRDLMANPAVLQTLTVLLYVTGGIALLLWLIGIFRSVSETLLAYKEEGRWPSLAYVILGGFLMIALHYLITWGLGTPASGSALEMVWGALLGAGVVLLLFPPLRDKRLAAPFVVTLMVALVLEFLVSQVGFEPKFWLIERPWVNNVALIVPGIWIWTGFSMVILSAAYKGIPADLLEAARIDGANEWQVFWNIIIPFMKSTLAVVTTTIVIFVLKMFDIVYVMTNGNYGTEVLANRMFRTMVDFRDYEKANAIAVVLLLLTIPFIYINIRRFRVQEEMR